MAYILTPSAEEDYDVVIRNLAERAGSWRWSLDVEERLLDAFDALARRPGLGHVREDLLPRRICFHNVPPYQVLYLPETKPLKIIGIFHGARDIAALMSARSDE
jgi:plasmid stabilization system protein ParE